MAIRIDNMVYSSGIHAMDPETGTIPEDSARQVELVFQHMRTIVESAGGSTDDIALVTTKSACLESVETLRSRVADASRYFPLTQLAVSPQCGFATSIVGNHLGFADQERKLGLVSEVARAIWG